MDWATEVFLFEYRTDLPEIVHRVWRTRSVARPDFVSIAMPHWQLVFMQHADGSKSIVARGPETVATRVPIPSDTEFLGIQFALGAFMPNNSVAVLVDNAVSIEMISEHGFWLNGMPFEIPTFENIDVFLDRLVRSGSLVHDPVVEQTLRRTPVSLTDRSIQRRFIKSTGLTYGTMRQMQRADRAVAHLRRGVPILDVVDMEGFSDQAHLTRSLRKFVGVTPARILAARG
jgi:AraC-like DNA-binding protein